MKEALQQHFKISVDKLLKHLTKTSSDLTDDDIRSYTHTHTHTCMHTQSHIFDIQSHTYSPSLWRSVHTCVFDIQSPSLLLSLPLPPHTPISLSSLSTPPPPSPLTHALTVEVCSLETTWSQERSHVSTMKFWTLHNSPPPWRSRPPIAAVALNS